ncbi:chromate efflux transporter [Dyadobacter sp. MSC1_007]|jgi:chromate transporter|uniref:chromate efflux transporter n=1 Tax=Dyadobacter sp. MSC1_007 TaxID=2909264 RepID=UPI00202E6620|nr:chromate efflux transporter [Dyadobacter sp. MSC1_007]
MNPTLRYLFLTFLKIGATSWGGFMALISMIQKKVLETDAALENTTILEGISLASVLPGPMAVNVVSFVGYKLGGWKGALVSVVAVLLPSFFLMLTLAHFYFLYGDVPAMSRFFAGMLPAVAAIIVSVAINLGKKSIQDVPQMLIAIAAAVIVFISKSYLTTLALILTSGLLGYFYYFKGSAEMGPDASPAPTRYARTGLTILLTLLLLSAFTILLTPLHRTILLTFSGMSISQFGGGYVIIPTMQKIVVEGQKWLTDKEFADAIAMGQVTPGPIFISATFIGYKLAGFWGALNATLSIFFPTAFLTVVCARFFDKISKSARVMAIFKALRPAIIGMIISSGAGILWSNGISPFTLGVFALALGITTFLKTDPVYVVPAAGILGLLIL